MAVKNLLLTNRNLLDLNPLIAGEESCSPGHSFGPYVRKYTLIHYVISGKGVFHARGGAYSLEPGQAFLILPGEVTTYTADMKDPWRYRWIGFDGKLSTRFSELPPVFSLPEDLFRKIMRFESDPSTMEYLLAAELFRLYSVLFSRVSGSNQHVRKVENYIRSSYMQPIRVEEIADRLNLDRHYLSRLFKQKTGLSIQEYLIHIRMEEAENHLRQGCSVKETARLVGYENASNFSKIFKKYCGTSPADFARKA